MLGDITNTVHKKLIATQRYERRVNSPKKVKTVAAKALKASWKQSDSTGNLKVKASNKASIAAFSNTNLASFSS